MLIATPEYNHSVPGQLKNALDWISRPLAKSPLRNKPVAVIGASTGLFGAVWAQAEVRKVATAMGASVVDRELPVGQAARRVHRGRPARRRRASSSSSPTSWPSWSARSAASSSRPPRTSAGEPLTGTGGLTPLSPSASALHMARFFAGWTKGRQRVWPAPPRADTLGR